jgi:hypothetical protein
LSFNILLELFFDSIDSLILERDLVQCADLSCSVFDLPKIKFIVIFVVNERFQTFIDQKADFGLLWKAFSFVWLFLNDGFLLTVSHKFEVKENFDESNSTYDGHGAIERKKRVREKERKSKSQFQQQMINQPNLSPSNCPLGQNELQNYKQSIQNDRHWNQNNRIEMGDWKQSRLRKYPDAVKVLFTIINRVERLNKYGDVENDSNEVEKTVDGKFLDWV